MIDYDLTIAKFFDSALKYLESRKSKVSDKQEHEKINKTIISVEKEKKRPICIFRFLQKTPWNVKC